MLEIFKVGITHMLPDFKTANKSEAGGKRGLVNASLMPLFPLKAQGCRRGISGPKEALAVVSHACLSTNGLIFQEVFILAVLGPQHISIDT